MSDGTYQKHQELFWTVESGHHVIEADVSISPKRYIHSSKCASSKFLSCTILEATVSNYAALCSKVLMSFLKTHLNSAHSVVFLKVMDWHAMHM